MSELWLARGTIATSMQPDVTNTSNGPSYKELRRMLGGQVPIPKTKRGTNRMRPKNRKR